MDIKDLDRAYRSHINEILEKSFGINYKAIFLEPNPAALDINNTTDLYPTINSIYVLGILERSHLACITSLARTSRWLSSTIRSIDDDNVLAFSSALRGLVESSSDSFYLMQNLFPFIEKACKYMYVSISFPEDIKEGYINFESIENLLIHYAYAKRWEKGQKPLPYHQNLNNIEYIRCLEKFGVSDLSDLYFELCQLTHPASPSVFCFIKESESSLIFNPDQDSSLINDILKRYQKTIIGLVQYPLNSSLITLALLHRLVPDWPSMSDKAMSTIGNAAQLLENFDGFSKEYRAGAGLSLSEIKAAAGW